jgi:CubicO group peptidase (beta-lactamase class C family)
MGDATITLEHLLTHTSGIPDYTELPEWWAIHRQDVNVNQLIDVFKKKPKAFAPGTNWTYSNSGYILLGSIIERFSEKSFGEFLTERIFEPLNMSNTSYESSANHIIPQMVSGYSNESNAYIHPEYLSYSHLYSAGGIVSTLDDLQHWFNALHAGKLLSAETLRKMWTPYLLADYASTHYGYGWWLSKCQGRPVVEHYGLLPGYVNYLLALPEDDILVILLSNDDGKLNQLEQLAVETAALTLGHPYQSPAPFKLSNLELSHFEGNYTTSDGMKLTLVAESGQLTLRTPLGQRFILQPQSQSEFFLPENPESRLVFFNTQNLVTGLKWLPRRGMPMQAQKTF